MGFNLEVTDMDLGDTLVENIFINDYMPMANGTYVKVYLLGYKYAYDKDNRIEVNNETIAKNLSIPMEDVLRAWDFWEEKGIIKKVNKKSSIDYNIEFFNLKQLYIKNNIGNINNKEKEKSIKTEPVKNNRSINSLLDGLKDPDISKMFINIDNIVRRQTTPKEKDRIIGWITSYNMAPEVIEKAFFYSYEIVGGGRKNLNYVEAIVINWYDEGINTLEDVMVFFEENNNRYYKYEKIMKRLGFRNRYIKEDEKKMVDRWLDEKDYSLDLILAACDRDKNTTPSFNYVNGILKSWEEKGIKEVEDIDRLDVREEKTRDKKPTRPKRQNYSNRFHNLEQRSSAYSEDDLEEVARRKRLEYMKSKEV